MLRTIRPNIDNWGTPNYVWTIKMINFITCFFLVR